MTVTYWNNFSKRKNSTKQPTTGTDVTVKLKEDCSIINPVFESATMPATANYIYVSEWGRYYFVTNVTYISYTTKSFSCEVDVLASFKSQIGSTVAHIAYSSTGYDKYIVDSRIATKPTFAYFDRQTASSGLSSQGVYILSVINGQSNGETGCITYYYIDYSYLDNLMTDLLDNTIWSQIKAMLDNPMDSVVNLIWVPLPYTALVSNVNIEATATQVELMGETLPNTYGFKVKDPISVLSSVSLQIPFRYQDYRDGQPYTNLSIYLPGLGLTDLNANDFIESTNVSIYTYVDFAHGDLTYWIYNDDGVVVKTCMFHCGVTVPIAHVSVNASGGVASIGGTVGGIATMFAGLFTGNIPMAMGGAGAGALASANSVLQFNTRSTSLQGSDVGRSAYENVIFSLVESVVDTEDPDDANYIATWGRPVGVTHAISNHSGYVQSDNASVTNIGTALEKDRVNQYLNTGFFYE